MSSPHTPGPAGMGPGARRAIRVVIAVIACIALVIPLTGAVVDFVQRVNTHEFSETTELPETITELEVAMDRARVAIVTTPSDTGRVVLDYRGSNARTPAVEVDTSGGVTRLSLTGMREGVGFGTNDEARVTVEIPETQARDLDLTSTATFARTDITGEYRAVTAETTSGFLTADVTTGTLRMSARSGGLRVAGTADEASLETTFGGIELDELSVARTLALETRTGGVDARLGTAILPVDGITIDVTSGGVDLKVPDIMDVEDTEAAGYRVNARSNSGAVDVGIREAAASEATVIPITVRTSSGGVNIGYL